MPARAYSRTAIALHWSIAGLLAFQIGMGLSFEGQPRGPALFSAFQMHKSLGILVLVLSLWRLAVRSGRQKVGAAIGGNGHIDNPWAAKLATLVHGAFYSFMLVGPLTGWVIVSSSSTKIPTLLFGMISLPHLPVPAGWHGAAKNAHGVMATVAIGLFGLHVAGALKHQLLHRDDTLQRMFPFDVSPPQRGLLAAMFAIGLLVLASLWANALRLPTGAGSPRVANRPASAVGLLNDGAHAVSSDPAGADQSPPSAEAADAGDAVLPAAEWAISSQKSLGFVARWSGTDIAGHFSRWSGDIKFSPENLEASRIRIRIDLASASTGDVQRDEMLAGESFFNTAANPAALFTSNRITGQGSQRYRISGTLTLNGRSRPLALNATIRIRDKLANVAGSAALDRTAFGIGSGDWASTDQIAGQVAISFDFAATRQ